MYSKAVVYKATGVQSDQIGKLELYYSKKIIRKSSDESSITIRNIISILFS